MKEIAIDPKVLRKLSEEFDRMVAAMQKPRHAAAVDRLMKISDKDLRAALRAGHKPSR